MLCIIAKTTHFSFALPYPGINTIDILQYETSNNQTLWKAMSIEKRLIVYIDIYLYVLKLYTINSICDVCIYE